MSTLDTQATSHQTLVRAHDKLDTFVDNYMNTIDDITRQVDMTDDALDSLVGIVTGHTSELILDQTFVTTFTHAARTVQFEACAAARRACLSYNILDADMYYFCEEGWAPKDALQRIVTDGLREKQRVISIVDTTIQAFTRRVQQFLNSRSMNELLEYMRLIRESYSFDDTLNDCRQRIINEVDTIETLNQTMTQRHLVRDLLANDTLSDVEQLLTEHLQQLV